MMEWEIINQIFWQTTTCAFLFVGGVYLFVVLDSTGKGREWFSEGPLGLRRVIAKPKAHAISKIEHSCFEGWAKHLSRSCRCTMLKQLPKFFEKEKVMVKSISPKKLGYKHFMVILSHECKHVGILKALFVSVIRFLVASLMCGTIDEFWKEDKLLGWSHAIIKGKTYRAMWFYQKQEFSKMFLWYKTLNIAITRVTNMPSVQYVDLGPSTSDEVVRTKEKLGFTNELDWMAICDYEGEFINP